MLPQGNLGASQVQAHSRPGHSPETGAFGLPVCFFVGARGVFKTRPHRQVLGPGFVSEAGSRREAGRPMQQAKYAAPLPALPGYETCCWRAAWAGRCFVQVWGRAAHPFIFGPRVETKGWFRTLFVAKGWPGGEQPGGSHTRGGNYTADGPAEPHYLVLISIRNGWARATCSVSAGSGEGTASRAPALVASRIHSFGNRLASFSPPPLAWLL